MPLPPNTGPQLPVGSFRPRSVCLVLLVTLAGCPKPSVDVPSEVGESGEFCVTEADCGRGMQCTERTCCDGDSCATMCSSLMEKDGSVINVASTRHPTWRRFVRRKCLSLCCEGAAPARIESSLRSWAEQLRPHGLPQINAP